MADPTAPKSDDARETVEQVDFIVPALTVKDLLSAIPYALGLQVFLSRTKTEVVPLAQSTLHATVCTALWGLRVRLAHAMLSADWFTCPTVCGTSRCCIASTSSQR